MENYTTIQVQCDEKGYSITYCPHSSAKGVLVGGYFCHFFCKYYKGRNRREKQVYCGFPQRPTPDHWLVKPYDPKARFNAWDYDVDCKF